MGSNTGHNAPCGCGSGKKYEDCCGAPKDKVTNMRVKDLNVFELTPGLPSLRVGLLLDVQSRALNRDSPHP
jgi:hypothetical protein